MTPDSTTSWWRRPCGGREVLGLALPLIISTGSWSLMHFVDRMYLFWYSDPAAAASMPAGVLHFAMLCFPLGVAMYVTTFVAQYAGAGQPERAGLAVWQGAWVGLAVVPLFLATIPVAPALFHLVGHDPEVARLEVTYFRVLTFGAGAAVISAAFSAFFTGRGDTNTVMAVECSATALNIVLDFPLIFGRTIFGHLDFLELGIAGAGVATVVAQWFKVLVYWRLMMQPAHREPFALVAGRRFDAPLFRRLLRFGGPNGLQLLVEVAGFTLFILLVGRIGPLELVATTLAFNVNSLAFLPVLGLGIAVSTIVGQQLGRNRPDLATRATWTAVGMALVYMGVMASLYVFAPDLFLMAYGSGADAHRFHDLREVTVVLLRFVAVYCLFDACWIIFTSAIRGAGDTRFILLINALMAPLPVLAGWWGIRFHGWGIRWCWATLAAWVSTMGLIFLVRFLQGRWRTMRVIEPELLVPQPEPHAVPALQPPLTPDPLAPTSQVTIAYTPEDP